MEDQHPKEQFFTFLSSLETELNSINPHWRINRKINRCKTLITQIQESLEKSNTKKLYKNYMELKSKSLELTKKGLLKKKNGKNILDQWII